MALTETTHEAGKSGPQAPPNPEAAPDAEEEELEFGDSSLPDEPGMPEEAPMMVDVAETKFSIFELVRKIDRGQLVLSPDYQRLDVWKPEQRSMFIESVLLNIPLPPLFLNQTVDGNYVVVDGKQRSTALYKFLKGNYALTGLEQLKHHNDKYFKDLAPADQAWIEDRSLSCHVLKPTVPLKVVYEIFYRINTGGTQLNGQEIRHGIYQGQSTEMLKRMADTDIFRRSVPISSTQRSRMRDQETILRCLAFQLKDPQTDYRGSMDDFLGSVMRQLNEADDALCEKLEQGFYRALERASLLGPNAYRIPTTYTRGRINVSVLESVLNFFWHLSDADAQRHADQIRSNYQKLFKDPTYLDAVQSATGTTARVRIRFARAREILGQLEEGASDAE